MTPFRQLDSNAWHQASHTWRTNTSVRLFVTSASLVRTWQFHRHFGLKCRYCKWLLKIAGSQYSTNTEQPLLLNCLHPKWKKIEIYWKVKLLFTYWFQTDQDGFLPYRLQLKMKFITKKDPNPEASFPTKALFCFFVFLLNYFVNYCSPNNSILFDLFIYLF